jgi:UDP-N-acetylmuramoylalanine--D-glutamate ligase
VTDRVHDGQRSPRPFDVARMRVVVVGAARSGVAAAEMLAGRGASVLLTDLNEGLPVEGRLRAAGIRLELGGHRAESLLSADLVVLSPGVPPGQPAVAAARRAGVPVIGEIELASRLLRGRVVAITGTKGKSTTTALAGAILSAGGLRAVVGGNIGSPLSAQVEASAPDVIHVVEVSSFQLETTETFHPWIAALLNLSPDHLDRHADLDEYFRAKARILANQDERDLVVVNAEDERVVAMAAAGRGRRLLYSVEGRVHEGISVEREQIVYRSAGAAVPLVPLSAVRLIGRHLLSDVLAAVAIGHLAGVAPPAMEEAVSVFSGLEHVMEPAGEIRGVRFVNDSKATNVEAARSSIENVPGPLVPIIGGHFKGGSLAALRDVIGRRARAVVAIGEARPLVHEALAGVVPIGDAATMRDAVLAAFEAAKPGDTVLLAPACASFDMFADYSERGRAFREEVARLAGDIGRRANGEQSSVG